MTAVPKKYPATSQRPPGRPKRIEDTPHFNTSKYILTQAQTLFTEKGFSAVSINDIVSAAEISKPTLYYYFPDKETLYAAVLVDIIDKASGCLADILEQPLPMREKLIALTDAFFKHAPASMPCLLRDVSQHLGEASSRKVLEMYRTRIYRPFEVLFQSGIACGELKPVQNPRLLTELFLTMLDWLTLRFSFHDGPPLEAHEKAAQVVELFLDGARNPLP
jgi:AcrR family transcriptional regulator